MTVQSVLRRVLPLNGQTVNQVAAVVEGSCIKPDSKKRMLSTIRGCPDKAELERYLWNALLKYEHPMPFRT